MLDRAFDVVICLLLVATIAHLALVQRRLRAFRAERDRLQAFVTALDLTVERAESAIRRLRSLQGDAAPAPVTDNRTYRNRSPEDLLRAARRAAGVSDRAPRGSEPASQPKGAGALADALQNALGS